MSNQDLVGMYANRPLLYSVWSKAEAAVLAAASNCRQGRIARQHSATIKTRHQLFVELHSNYVKSQPINTLIIPPADLFRIDEVKAVFASVPFDQDMTAEYFAHIIAKLPSFSEAWVNETTLKLLGMGQVTFAAAFAPEPVPENVLDLAVTARAFNCGCRRLGAQQALAHRGFYSWGAAAAVEDLDLRLFSSNTNQHFWNENKHIEFDITWFDRSKDVLQTLGYDWKTLTADEMDEMDDIFECTTCTSFTEGRDMHDWRSLVGAIMSPRGVC